MRSGDISEYGFPKPDHKVGHAHPTVSDEIHDRLEAGAVTPKPNIRELRGDRVLFEDGSEVEADVIVYCTGYKVSFPFFDEGFISAPDNDLPLYRRTFHPEIEGVYFLGLAQPLGAIMPMAEQQAKWIAALLRGEYALPPAAEMRGRHRRRARAPREALLQLQAPHDGGRLRRVDARLRARAPRGRARAEQARRERESTVARRVTEPARARRRAGTGAGLRADAHAGDRRRDRRRAGAPRRDRPLAPGRRLPRPPRRRLR